MKILSPAQIKEADQFTIKNEPISSLDLMERASQAFCQKMIELIPIRKQRIVIFAGVGNNGGDGLAIARILSKQGYQVIIYTLWFANQASPDFTANYERINRKKIRITDLYENAVMPPIYPQDIVIDAIFGIGLSRPLEGLPLKVVQHINQFSHLTVAVDIPSGLFADKHTATTSINANYTISFQSPKLCFLMPENENRVGEWHIQDIALDPSFLQSLKSPHHYIQAPWIKAKVKTRDKFAYKTKFGRALVLGGSYGMIGAVLLSTKACLRVGAGLVTSYIPQCGYPILQAAVPEAMCQTDPDQACLTQVPDLSAYSTIMVGMGMGQSAITQSFLRALLEQCNNPILIDADGLNIIAKNQDLLADIPRDSILTPHLGEFDRLFGPSENDFERLEKACQAAKQYRIYIVLKGAHTCIACPDGQCYFNSSGNPAMATGGSGDVLAGMIGGLLAQSYSPKDSALLGVYYHGKAGDDAIEYRPQIIASDLIELIAIGD